VKGRTLLLALTVLAAALVPLSEDHDGPRVGSKKFTENVILGEIVAALSNSRDVEAVHARELGGTRILFEALLSGEIDVYPEYTGTITQEILAGEGIDNLETMRVRLAERGVLASEPLGFNNSYAIGMLEVRAAELGIRTVSDLASHPDLAFGFGNEFMDREDGWPSLRRTYGLPQRNVSGMDHDLAYRQLEAGSIDAMEVYTTDAGIVHFGIRTLEDDRRHFPSYEALFLYREDLDDREPEMVRALTELEGRISERGMMAMNASAQIERVSEGEVARKWLSQELGVRVSSDVETRGDRLWRHTLEHLALVRTSFLLALLVGIPLGIFAAKRKHFGQVVLGSVGVIQTIPALALLVILIGPAAALGLTSIGTGSAAAITALFLYSLLPIVRNTCEGLSGIAPELLETADALGLPPRARLRLIELPLASRTILAGLKTAAVLNVGFATLGALIGAGGYGQPILTGIRLDDYALILEGAVPSAGLALLTQVLFEIVDRILVPKGLRL